MPTPDFLTRRNDTWHFQRRVPLEFAQLDRRGTVRHTTKVRVSDDRTGRRAARVAAKLNQELEAHWRALAQGSSAADLARYDEARRRAREFGFDYLENALLVQLPPERRLERLRPLLPRERLTTLELVPL